MSATTLRNKNVAIVATVTTDPVKVSEAKSELEDMGAEVEVLSVDTIRVANPTLENSDVLVDNSNVFAEPTDYDALVVDDAQNQACSSSAGREIDNYVSTFHIVSEDSPVVALSSSMKDLEES